MDAMTLTADRFAKQQMRTAKDFGWGDTQGAQGIAATYLEEATAAVEAAKVFLKPREHGSEIAALDSQLVALVGLTTGLSAVANGETLARLCLITGEALESECYAVGLSNWDETRAAELMARVKRDHRNLKYRKTALRSLAQKAKFPWTKWKSSEKGMAGRWLVEVMLETSVFMLDDEGNPTITQDAVDVSDRIVADLQERHPVLLPVTERPAPWKSEETTIDGYRVSLIRSRDALVHKTVRMAIKDKTMQPALDALNAAQEVAYRINEPILEVVKWCYSEGIKVPGLPPRDNLPLPEATPEIEADEKKLKAHRKARGDIRKLNRSFLGERLGYDQDIATAEHLAGAPFWTHLNFDYRGRVYGVPRFNFQRQDYVRAMFEFDQGEVLTEDGLYWLKVHVANCGDFGKISKRPFDERVTWADENWLKLMGYAMDPEAYLEWTKADKPFLFLAGCMALRDAHKGRPVHAPVSFDGTCSGLQHLAAMTRCPDTARLVNLTDAGLPQDVYQVVADKARVVVERDTADEKLGEVARACLAYGIDRKLVKRNVMTFSYSSKAFGMSEQHMEDTMVPLQYEVLSGKREAHPFEVQADTFKLKTGAFVTLPGHTASRYLSKVVYNAIKETVERPAEAMAFLQGIARTMSHEGKPVVWHTPLGFPVVMRYANTETKQIKLTLHDKGVPINVKPRIAVELAGIDKRRATSAIAPSFVHSLDACHLMTVILDANTAGISSVALVHDSFGCLPNAASRYRDIIREAFYQMYERNDVLFDILRESAANLDTSWHRLPDLPPKGDYEMSEVLQAPYSFA